MAILFWPQRSTSISCHLRRALHHTRCPRGWQGNAKSHAIDHWLEPQGTRAPYRQDKQAPSQLFVSLNNGPKAFVVTGPSKALFGLVTSLRKVKAPSSLDQSKVPFSQRKPVFSIRFVVVGVPYHSKYLARATETLIKEDLEGEELWSAKDIKIPVYNTEDGEIN